MQEDTPVDGYPSKQQPSDAPKKDTWDKLDVLSKYLIPLSVVCLGFFVSSALKQREVQAKYVELAILALQSEDESREAESLQRWALRVLRETSPVPIPPELEVRALNLAIQRSGWRSAGGYGQGWGFVEVHAEPDRELYVYVDGVLRATTPTTLNLRTGHHSFRLVTEEGDIVGAAELELAEHPSKVVAWCEESGSVVVSEVSGVRMRVERPGC